MNSNRNPKEQSKSDRGVCIQAEWSSRFPIHGILLKVGIDRGAYGWVEVRGTEALEQLEALELVLHRVLHFRKLKFDARCAQLLLQLGQHVRRSHVDARDGLRG